MFSQNENRELRKTLDELMQKDRESQDKRLVEDLMKENRELRKTRKDRESLSSSAARKSTTRVDLAKPDADEENVLNFF